VRSYKATLAFSLLLIAVGVGWLLTALAIAPEIDWVWTVGLAAVGLLSFVVGGLDKVTAVVGPFFLSASGLSLARQTGHLTAEVEAPILAIVAGALLVVAHWRVIPLPKWIRIDASALAQRVDE